MNRCKITLIETKDGSYGMHGQTGWDDLPYWEFWPAWIVDLRMDGLWDFGPYKLGPDAQHEYAGTTHVHLQEGHIDRDQKKAEDLALELALSLEERGFAPEIGFLVDYSTPRNLRKKLRFLDDRLPIELRWRLKDEYRSPSHADLYAKEGKNENKYR